MRLPLGGRIMSAHLSFFFPFSFRLSVCALDPGLFINRTKSCRRPEIKGKIEHVSCNSQTSFEANSTSATVKVVLTHNAYARND